MQFRCRPNGDRMLLVEFEEEISLKVNNAVHRLARILESQRISGVVECIPSYRTLGVVYDPVLIPFRDLADRLRALSNEVTVLPSFMPKRVEIPVCYGGEFGPDLDFVASHNQRSPEEVVKIHSEKEYQVFLIGFAPGFPYLGELPSTIAAPRLPEPRRCVPAGSVAIGGSQTGIYPIESPGGWRIIGRTSLRLFDPGREFPFLLNAGDQVVIRPICQEEYDA
jgi:inhibitor of KinA